VGRFLCGRPSSTPTWPISAHEPAYQPITVTPSLIDGARLLALSSPKSSLLCSPAWQCRPNYWRWAGHPSPPCATRMAACSLATLSHHVDCGALWRPITAAHLRLLSSSLCRSDSEAKHSVTRPRAGYFTDPAAGAKGVPSRLGHSLPFVCLGSVRWHAHACRVANSSATPYLAHPSQ
jgi:hypothetical protein